MYMHLWICFVIHNPDTPKISSSIGKRTIDNELKTTLEFELDVPEPDEIVLLLKKNDSDVFVPGKVDKNQHIFTCYFPICCSGKYELVVKTHFGAVHRQTIDLKIPKGNKFTLDNKRKKHFVRVYFSLHTFNDISWFISYKCKSTHRDKHFKGLLVRF